MLREVVHTIFAKEIYVVLNQERENKGMYFCWVLMRVGHKNLSAANDVMIVTNDPVLQARLMKPSC